MSQEKGICNLRMALQKRVEHERDFPFRRFCLDARTGKVSTPLFGLAVTDRDRPLSAYRSLGELTKLPIPPNLSLFSFVMATSTKSGSKSTAGDATDQAAQKRYQRSVAGLRESVESVCVAIILALLFRGFVAEAFVIPTGSMAPTLMGAHKDLFCEECGYNFRVGASVENLDPQTYGGQMGHSQDVVAGRCPICRKQNILSLQAEANDATFSGDRILVSKFAYAIQEPKRWDVIVFKYPGNPKQNYIKRLVGLPEETLRVDRGDIYTRPLGSDVFTIARKPDFKVMPTAHIVYDSAYQATDLLEAGFPSRLQPWRLDATEPPTDSWQIEQSQEGMTATVQANDKLEWLRYFHNVLSDVQRAQLDDGGEITGSPYHSTAITDFYQYDSYVTANRGEVRGPNGFSLGYSDGVLPRGSSDNGLLRGGLHWVGDLTFEVDLETDSNVKEAVLLIVEAGVHYRCTIDLTSGTATLSIDGSEPYAFDDGEKNRTATTSVLAGESHTLRFSNIDNQLRLWVDGSSIEFDRLATFDPATYGSSFEDRPHTSSADPLDAAPVGIAVAGGTATVDGFRLYRDQYYIASRGGMKMNDYDSSPSTNQIHRIMDEPQLWAETNLFSQRRIIEFELEADQFFPMGDNSPESKDARSWVSYQFPPVPDEDAYKFARSHFVPRDLLVGKALLVFWPHPWNRPVPFTPNVKRIKLIR